MTARLAAALTASASRGLAMVTKPGAGAQRAARRKPRRASRPGRPRHHDGMAAIIFVPLQARQRKLAVPQGRHVLEGSRLDIRQHRGGNADLGDRNVTAIKPPRQKEMARLLAKEGHRLNGADGHAHDGARRAVDPARQVDRDDRLRPDRSCFR